MLLAIDDPDAEMPLGWIFVTKKRINFSAVSAILSVVKIRKLHVY